MANTRKNPANTEDTSRQVHDTSRQVHDTSRQVHNTNPDGSTNPNVTEETTTQLQDTNPTDDTTQAVVPTNAQMARELQEATKTMKDFMAMMAQFVPGMVASAAAQQGMSLTNPAIAAQQRTTQTLQQPNPPIASAEATHGCNQQTRTPGPVIAQHSASEARSNGTQPGGSSSSPIVQQAMMSGSACPPTNSTLELRNTGVQIGGSSFSHVAPIVTTPVEATTSAPRSSFVTKDDLDAFVKEIQNKSSMGVLDLKLPYNQRIAIKPYPKDYVSPKFMLFNGKNGSAKEHLLKFIETLGVYGLDDDLRVKEFSKSLTEKAYTWYVNLQPGSVDSWSSMCKMFLEKFFSTQERVTLIDMGRIRQKPKEDLMEYIERFRERSLDIQDVCDEKELVKICIQGMFTEYAVHLENLNLCSFAMLVENARRTNNSVSRRRGDGLRFRK